MARGHCLSKPVVSTEVVKVSGIDGSLCDSANMSNNLVFETKQHVGRCVVDSDSYSWGPRYSCKSCVGIVPTSFVYFDHSGQVVDQAQVCKGQVDCCMDVAGCLDSLLETAVIRQSCCDRDALRVDVTVQDGGDGQQSVLGDGRD